MPGAHSHGIVELLKRHPLIAVALIGLLALIVWSALPEAGNEAVGAACNANRACRSGICLPDADPREVANFIELIRAYEQGQDAQPGLAGEIEELLAKLPRSSLTLRPRYPGVCTETCTSDRDCPPAMFCIEAVWMGVIKGIDRGRLQVCMPEDHPAERLMRLRGAHGAERP